MIPTANDGNANIYLVAPGTIAVTGDTTIDDNATINNGTVIVDKDVTLTLSDVALNGTFVQVGAGANLAVEGSGAVATLDHVSVLNEGTIQVDESDQTATLIGDDGTTITGGTLSVGASGLVESENGSNALGIALDGVNVVNNGELEANGATFFVDSTSTVCGTGDVIITGGGLADFACAFEQNVTFQGAGTLELQQSLRNGDYSGLVTGFGAGDTVDLRDLAYSASEYAVWTQVTAGSDAAGTLQIYNSDRVLEETLNLAGTYTQGEFALADDGTAAHGTSVNFNFISFFNGQTNFSDNASFGYTGPQISPDGSAVTLTNDLPGEYGSWFDHNTHSITAFTASFDYQATGAADGMAFILQNDPRGAGALGTDFADNGGSGLGYTGISPSAAVEFNFFNGHVQGTNFETNGTTGIYNPTGDVPLIGNGDNIQVVLSYDGSVLTETLTDLTDGATYSTSYTGIDLSQIVGSDSAYIGFSAATGGFSSTQIVSDFNFASGQAVHWAGESGQNWTDADVWTDGNENTVPTPNAASNVFIDEGGPGYTLEINSADTANLLAITAAAADVQDETGGSLALNGALTIDAGSFSLIGGALSAASIYVGANGHFIGYGSVVAPLDNDGGFVEAQQNLSLLAPVTGDGSFQIDNAAVLEFGGSVAGGTVTFGSETGTLKLDHASSFNGEIAGITGYGDVINLAGFDFSTTTAAAGDYNSENNTTPLLVSDANQSVTLTLVGNLSETSWSVASVDGGVAISDPPTVDLSATPDGVRGTVTFADGDTSPQTASFTPQGSDYIGTFTLDAADQEQRRRLARFPFRPRQRSDQPGARPDRDAIVRHQRHRRAKPGDECQPDRGGLRRRSGQRQFRVPARHRRRHDRQLRSPARHHRARPLRQCADRAAARVAHHRRRPWRCGDRSRASRQHHGCRRDRRAVAAARAGGPRDHALKLVH